MRDTLRDEIAAFLDTHGASMVTEIALGVRARRRDVEHVLSSGGFRPTQRPEGANPRAVYYEASRPVPATTEATSDPKPVAIKRDGRSRALAMLEVLEDGRRHSRDDIFRRAGRFFLTNNAAAELRRAGYDVRHERDGDLDLYWLVSEPSRTEPETTTTLPSAATPDAALVSGSVDEEQPDRLFAAPAVRGATRTGHAA